MDLIQQRILEIALQIPEYVGYAAKDRRREMDKYTRRQLAQKYSELDVYLARVQKRAPLAHIVDLENLDQKLQRLIARFNTALTGYAGWFNAAQIGETDIDALTRFDATLANGVPGLKAAIEQIAAALKAQAGVEEAIDACAEMIDNLNAQFDQREQFLATGKKPSLDLPTTSPLSALEAKKKPDADLVALTNLKLNDAVTFAGVDYLVAGKITFTPPTGSFWAILLQDGGKQVWLRIAPGNEIAACQEIRLVVPSPLPDSLTHDNQTWACEITGQATAVVEGAGGAKRGTVNYARYLANSQRLWVEDFGGETRVMLGDLISASEIKVYRR